MFKNKVNIIILTAIISIGLGFGANAAVKSVQIAAAPAQKTISKPLTPATKSSISIPSGMIVDSLDVVSHPAKYLNKRVTIRAKFDKFSTLGLDYKPAYKSSEKFITFLIKREDIINHTVPLSEMKNFLPKSEAEKHIDLKTGDLIEYSGVVFSNALGDVWIDVDKFKVLSQQKAENSTKK